MASTRNFVPRANNEGSVGIALKKWAAGFIKVLTVDSIKIETGAGANKILTSDADGDGTWENPPLSFIWSAITTGSTNATAQNGYICDTTGGAITLTLPASPAVGDIVSWKDGAGTFNTNNLTIGRNGKKIMGLEEDMVVSENNAGGELVYYDTTNGWRL